MKKIFFLMTAIVAATVFGMMHSAIAQNLVDPASDETDLSDYSPYAGRSAADSFYETEVVRRVTYRQPVLAATSLYYQHQYGLTSINTRQLDYQHRRSGWRLVEAEPDPLVVPKAPVIPSGEIIGRELATGGLPAGSVEVVGAELARFRVNPGIRLFKAPSGKFYYIEDERAPGSKGARLTFGEVPEGSEVVHPASVGVTSVPEGFVIVLGPDSQLYLAPANRFGR